MWFLKNFSSDSSMRVKEVSFFYEISSLIMSLRECGRHKVMDGTLGNNPIWKGYNAEL